ncbi:MAG TPA: DUF47 family protein [Solirubrobacteraceae bacterium]|jgi:uncharacterized protein Yka (UPF0111/DUF47 family)|nr:DUF47 family protein [Solirubrobacteraceae bacterium]
MRLPGRRRDPVLLELLDESGRNVQRAALLLHELLSEYPEKAGLAHDLVLCEQQGDRIAHDIIHRLHQSRRRRGIDATDGHRLATTLDDIVDFAEQTADIAGIYAVEAPMEQSVELAAVLVDSAQQVAEALRAMRGGAALAPILVEINRLENEGDRIYREAMASLFQGGIDPMVVIRWKDLFERLEEAIDACERVAHVLEGIQLKAR